MNVIKLTFVIAVALMLTLTGCGTGKNKSKETESVTREEQAVTPTETEKVEKSAEIEENQTDSSVNLVDIKDEIKETLNVSGGLDFNENSLKILYGIDKGDIKQYAGFSVAEGTFPHEVVMVEASSDEAAKKIESAFEVKTASFTEQSKNYDAENYALAQKCEIQKNGNFYALFLSPDYESIKEIYNKYVK